MPEERFSRTPKAFSLEDLRSIVAWEKIPKGGAIDHPIGHSIFCHVEGLWSVGERFVPPDWPHYYRFTDEPIAHRTVAPIYGGRRITDWNRRAEPEESFPPRTPRPLSEIETVGPVDVSEADAIAEAVQWSIERHHVVMNGRIMEQADEPCIRVHTGGKVGDKLFLSISHGVHDHANPGVELVMYFRLDQLEAARNAAREWEVTLDTEVRERGSIEELDASQLRMDPESTTWRGLAGRLHDIMWKAADELPTDVMAHARRLKALWTGKHAVTVFMHPVEDEGSLVRSERDEWLEEWRSLQKTLGGRLLAREGMSAWCSRFVMANEAIRLAVAHDPMPAVTDIDWPEPSTEIARDVCEATFHMIESAGSAFSDAWFSLRDCSEEDTAEKLRELIAAPIVAFPSAAAEKKWFGGVLRDLERCHAGLDDPTSSPGLG